MSSTAEKTVKRIVRTRGALAALVTAASLALAFVVLRVLSTIVSFLGFGMTDALHYDVPGMILQAFLAGIATVIVFAIGYFLSLWFVAPISERLGLAHVITRSVLAAGIGSTLWFVVGAVVAVVTTLSFGGSLFGFAFPGLVGLGDVPGALLRALQDALQLFLGILPLAVLGGILLWRWRTAHPPEYHVEGLVDV